MVDTLITCERCDRTTADPDRWDPEADTGRIFCDRCWDHRNEPRFTVDPADGWTECDCPESLCTHDGRDGGPLGMRPYRAWTVWDNGRGDHAYITRPTVAIDVDYERKRDADAVAKRLNDV